MRFFTLSTFSLVTLIARGWTQQSADHNDRRQNLQSKWRLGVFRQRIVRFKRKRNKQFDLFIVVYYCCLKTVFINYGKC
jgi:hypothetical protein